MTLTDTDVALSAIPKDVLALCKKLREHEKRGWIVGGCVRDLLLGRQVADWDVATDARPADLPAAFRGYFAAPRAR